MKLTSSLPFFILFIFLIINTGVSAAATSVLVVEINDTIDRPTVELLTQALQKAENDNFEAIILTLNTPGGGLQETFEIADIIYNSSIPIIGYVYPSGSYAWFLLCSQPACAYAGRADPRSPPREPRHRREQREDWRVFTHR